MADTKTIFDERLIENGEIDMSPLSRTDSSCIDLEGETNSNRNITISSWRSPRTVGETETDRLYQYCEHLEETIQALERETNLMANSNNQSETRRSRNRRSVTANIIPNEIIDLSETLNAIPNNNLSSDDVIIVSSTINSNPVVDLCSPARTHVRRSRNRNSRQLPVPTIPTSPHSRSVIFPDDELTVVEENVSPNTANDTFKNGNLLMCPVCLENCVKKNPIGTKCGHVFCENCIEESIRLHKKCPICNKRLTSKMLVRLYM